MSTSPCIVEAGMKTFGEKSIPTLGNLTKVWCELPTDTKSSKTSGLKCRMEQRNDIPQCPPNQRLKLTEGALVKSNCPHTGKSKLHHTRLIGTFRNANVGCSRSWSTCALLTDSWYVSCNSLSGSRHTPAVQTNTIAVGSLAAVR